MASLRSMKIFNFPRLATTPPQRKKQILLWEIMQVMTVRKSDPGLVSSQCLVSVFLRKSHRSVLLESNLYGEERQVSGSLLSVFYHYQQSINCLPISRPIKSLFPTKASRFTIDLLTVLRYMYETKIINNLQNAEILTQIWGSCFFGQNGIWLWSRKGEERSKKLRGT